MPRREPTGVPFAASGPDPVLATLAVLTALTVLGYGFAPAGRPAQVTVGWVLVGACHVVLVHSAVRAARGAVERSTRRVWLAFAAAGAGYLTADIAQLVTVVRDPHGSAALIGGPVQFGLATAATVGLVVVLLTTPLGAHRTGERSRFWLDLATVLAAAATFGLWAATIAGAPAGNRAAGLLDRLLSGPEIFLVGAFAVARLMLAPVPAFSRAAGLACGCAATVESALQVVPSAWHARVPVGWVLAAHLVANVLLATAARLQQLHQSGASAVRRRPRRPYSVLPYAAVAATYTLLVGVLAVGGLDRSAWIVVIGAIVSTVLVVARQLMAFRRIAEVLAERDLLAAELAHQAFHDSLTGLANRALLLRRLTAALTAGAGAVTVLLVDLDDFKPVNDRYGHAAGDRVLVRVAEALSACVRDGDTVARLGGDEFAVLLPDVPAGDRDAVVARIADCLCRQLAAELDPPVRASIGAAVGSAATHTPDQLLDDADLAMYAAKARGKGTLVLFDGAQPRWLRSA